MYSFSHSCLQHQIEVSSQLYALSATLLRRKALISTEQEVDWTRQTVCFFGEEKNFLIYVNAIVFASTLQYVITVQSLMLCNQPYDYVGFPCTCGKNLLMYKTCLFDLRNVYKTRQEFLTQLTQWLNMKFVTWNCI